MNIAYSINLTTGVVYHNGRPESLVCDGDGLSSEVVERRMAVSAAVRSGDYFITLATTLDALCKEAASTNQSLADELSMVVSDLIYLQSSYEIDKKPGVQVS